MTANLCCNRLKMNGLTKPFRTQDAAAIGPMIAVERPSAPQMGSDKSSQTIITGTEFKELEGPNNGARARAEEINASRHRRKEGSIT